MRLNFRGVCRFVISALILVLLGCVPTSSSSEQSEGSCPFCSKPANAEKEIPTSAEETTPTTTTSRKQDVSTPAGVTMQTVKYPQLIEVIRKNKGKVIVVDVWASFCVPCKKEFPDLVKLHKKYPAADLLCVSVSVDQAEDAGAALKFLQKVNATFPNYRLDEDPMLWQEKWLVKGIPAVFVFARDGTRAAKFTNDDPDKQFTYKDVEPLVHKLVMKK